jgi:hypothetical protein
VRLPAPDRLIAVAMAAAVVAVAAFAGVVSYSHFYVLGLEHGQDGTAARLTPLSVDLLILAAALTLLWAARNKVPVPWPVRAVLVAGVAATIAGNVLYSFPRVPVGPALSAWPGVAFVAAVEILMWLVRAHKLNRGPGRAGPVASDAGQAARASLMATLAAGNPLSVNQLQARFSLTRGQATALRNEVVPVPAVTVNGDHPHEG